MTDKTTLTLILEVIKPLLRKDTDAHKPKHKLLIFANTHKYTEAINVVAKRNQLKCDIHRAGLSKSHIKEVEEKFRNGKLDALVATPTLELGIDIGDVDSVVSVLVNHTRLLQRMGRAGRKGQESFAILTLRENDPISTYYKNNPNDYFTDIEPAYIEPRNEVVAKHQILAAAIDRPIGSEFSDFDEIQNDLIENGLLTEVPNPKGPPLRVPGGDAEKLVYNYNIRGIGDSCLIFDGETKIGERNMPMALKELHPGAIYLHGGRGYKSTEITRAKNSDDWTAKVIKLPSNNQDTTKPLRYSIPYIVKKMYERKVFEINAAYCKLRITEAVEGYIPTNVFGTKPGELVKFDSPYTYEYETKGVVVKAPMPKIKKGIESDELEEDEFVPGSFHALEHVLIESSNMLLGGGSNEIGGISLGSTGYIFIYDGTPGGSGLSKLLFSRMEKAFERSLKVLQSCGCDSFKGCPNCTYSYQCGNNNKILYKNGAMDSLRMIISGSKSALDEKEIPTERGYV